jgi:hypothetical protein
MFLPRIFDRPDVLSAFLTGVLRVHDARVRSSARGRSSWPLLHTSITLAITLLRTGDDKQIG